MHFSPKKWLIKLAEEWLSAHFLLDTSQDVWLIQHAFIYMKQQFRGLLQDQSRHR